MTWNQFSLAPTGSATLTSGMAVVSRIPNSMELWYVGQDGSIQGVYWYEGSSWQGYQLAPAGTASNSDYTSIAAVSRIPESMELWWVGADRSVQGAYWYEGSSWQGYQLAAPGNASHSNIAVTSRVPNSMELWYVGIDGSIVDYYWYQGSSWQSFSLAGTGSASVSNGAGVAAVTRVTNSMELWWIGADGSVQDNYWYQDPIALPSLSSNNNALLIDNCTNLQNLAVTLSVNQDLNTYQDTGFTVQLNAYPPPGQLSQGQTLNIFQYVIYIANGSASYEIQYWAAGASLPWPSGYTPVPGTTPWLPVFPNDFNLTSFGSVPSSRLLAGSTLTIALSTDSSGNVTSALFRVVDPTNHTSSATFPFPSGTQYPISAFEVDVVGPGGGSNTTFISGAGTLTYTISSGSLSVQNGGPGAACGEAGVGTAETSNVVYGGVTPATSSTVSQSLTIAWDGTPAAVGSALDGYWDSAENSQHVNFVSLDGHIHELYIHPGANWVDNDLTAFANGVSAVSGSALDGYWDSAENSQHVNFIAGDGHVHELYIHPGANWVDNDLTAFANGTPAAPGSTLDRYWGSDNSQHVNFVSLDGHVHELYIHPGANWVDNDLSAAT